MVEEDTTNAKVLKILPIHRASIHRICSGEGILDLASAVKELVENSLDAGANKIYVRLKEYGTNLIEVADNGPGVSPDCYQALTLKYYTSKIVEFADLQRLSSFGFRGEALSSLCALAKVTITTRTADDQVATRLEYDHSGLITSQTCVARCVGTTVSVASLFCPLPVRFNELRRNVKREYARLVMVLQAYALMSKRVRLFCSNNAGKAGRKTVIQTQGALSIRENIVEVFGSKTIRLLDWIDISIPEACHVEGFLSKPKTGTGRSSGDRQYFFLNGRPVDLPKAAKYLNELYRLFNPNQYPIVVFNFTLPTTAYDINVSPDKRKVFVHTEGDLMRGLVVALQKEYDQRAISQLDLSSKEGTTHKTVEPLESGRRKRIKKIVEPTPRIEEAPLVSTNEAVRDNETASVTSDPEADTDNSCQDLGHNGDVERGEVSISATSCSTEYRNQKVTFPDRVSSKFKRFRQNGGDSREEDEDIEKEEVPIRSASDSAEHRNQQVGVSGRFPSKFKLFRQRRGDLGEDGKDVEMEEVSIRSTSDMAENSSPQVDIPRGILLKPFRPSLMLKSFRQNSYSAILSTASLSTGLPRSAPSETPPHGPVQARLTGMGSRFKRQLEESGKWPPLKKCVLPNAAALDEKASEASPEVVEINDEQVQEGPQLKNLRQGRVSDWFTGVNESSERDVHHGATSSKPESLVQETGGLRIQGRVSDCFTESSERDAHQEAMSSKPESLLHETWGLRSNLQGGLAKQHGFSSASDVEVPSKLPSVLGSQHVTLALTKNSSMNSQCRQKDMSVLDHVETRKQKLKPSVPGSEGLKRSVSVLPFNRLEAAEVEEAVHPPKKISIMKFDMERLHMLSKRGFLGHGKKGSSKMQESTMTRSFKFATVGDDSIGKKSTEKQAALQAATRELEQNLKKTDFKHMKVIGQFDLRFILAKLNEDIFIVDQHASDETYNFEHLMRTAVVESQLLLTPVPLELEAADERIVKSHMKTFRRSGFYFLKDRKAAVGHKLKLSAIPSCIDGTVALQEIRELISLLAKQPCAAGNLKKRCSCQSSSWLLRSSRSRAMFASQACKSAKGVGDVLSKKEMEEVVSRMAELEAPWTCPHGRPTIRHMVDLCSIVSPVTV